MDPIGRTWQGYKGEWWPADDVERFATTFGGGRIYTAWAFPGGVVPADHPVLPKSAYPTATGRPGESPSVSELPTEPIPSGDIPPTTDPPVGEPPGDVPNFADFQFTSDIAEVKEPGVGNCLAQPPPAGCPPGIRGFIDLGGLTLAKVSVPPTPDIRVLYADAIAPGVYQLLIEGPPGTTSDLWYWTTAGKLRAAEIEAAMLDGKPVFVATVTIDPTTDFSFVATASGDGSRAIGTVGSLDVGS